MLETCMLCVILCICQGELVEKGTCKYLSSFRKRNNTFVKVDEASAWLPPLLFSEHVCSIIASMLRNLKSQQRSRLLNKFTENDCEKVSFFCHPLAVFLFLSSLHISMHQLATFESNCVDSWICLLTLPGTVIEIWSLRTTQSWRSADFDLLLNS